MGLLDRFLNAIKLNDDFDEDEDEDYLDDEDDYYEDDPEEDDRKSRGGFFSRFRSYDEDENPEDELPEEDEDDFDEAPVTPRRSAREKKKARTETARRSAIQKEKRAEKKRERTRETKTANRSKVTPIRKKNAVNTGNGVNVIRPTSMEDTPEIADYLMNNSTVVLNLEGLDIEIAQRVIDFTCGVCYSLDGSLQKVSSYIFILTPRDVDISGDFQSILSGAFDIPAMKSTY